MKHWLRNGALALGITGALIGGGALGAYAQTSDDSSSSSNSATADSDSGTTTTPAPADSGAAAAPEDCPGM